MKYPPEKIRNIAIIAHIDHGKTTIIDALLKQSDMFRDNEEVQERMMDSNTIEQERGITIFAKHTSFEHEGTKINVIDTPGHADFSGEVERVLGMVNAVLLLVDAQEGPMPQTRFVLTQALRKGLKVIVVLNKIDRPHANPEVALDKTFDLFVELGANDEQLDFDYCYASGLAGFAKMQIDDPEVDMKPMFKMIVDKVPAPPGCPEGHFLMQASTLSYNDYRGRTATGRILQGTIRVGDTVKWIDQNGHPSDQKITHIESYRGIKKIEIEEASAGDIVNLAGIPDVMIGDTLCCRDQVEQLPRIEIGQPTLSVDILVNNGPFCGREGKHVTFNKIRERLLKEKRANVSLTVEEVDGRDDMIRVSGRGELHISVLLETMRRENYEFVVSKPQVVTQEIDGVKHEPNEAIHIEVPDDYSGSVIEELSRRGAEMKNLVTNEQGITTLEFLGPTRSLLGYRPEFLTATRGLGILTSIFDSYQPWKSNLPKRMRGVMVNNTKGKATPYAIFALQDRGDIFVKATTEVYEGMVVGYHAKANDLVVNITKEKNLTNVRASGSDENIILTPPRTLTLEDAINFIEEDEFVEITPQNIRLRKIILNETERKRKKP
ncbi:MAG: GTP-binding protein TypA/BipA [Chlamydiia bacterium]|nr:GTP-binding protein TypA/BipA [Chlamydiia bacterium]